MISIVRHNTMSGHERKNPNQA